MYFTYFFFDWLSIKIQKIFFYVILIVTEMKTLGVIKLEMEPIYGDDPPEPPAVSAVCTECDCTIADRYIMRVSGRSYHERCLKCTTCSLKLDRSCFVWNTKLYCRQDYDK